MPIVLTCEEQFRALICGPEADGQTPEAAIGSAYEALRRTLQAHVESIDRFTAASVDDPSRELLQTIHADLLEAKEGTICRSDLRVALMGRTMSGKSTLFTYLTGSDGSRIGKGAQRTTRENLELPLRAVPGCTLIDTPGVGARDGLEDRIEAFGAALSCDLIVWVSTNESFQQEVGESIVEAAKLGKPVWVFMNCREDISSDARVRRLIRNPERLKHHLSGHWNRLESFLSPHGFANGRRFQGHALAAHKGALTSRTDLIEASGVSDLVAALKIEVQRYGRQRRFLSAVDTTRGTLLDSADSAQERSETLLTESDGLQQLSSDIERGLRSVLTEQEAAGRNAIQARLNARRSWHLHADLFGDLTGTWEQEVGSLRQELDVALRTTDDAVRDALEEEIGSARDDWDIPLTSLDPHPIHLDVQAKGNRAAKIALRVGIGTAAVVGTVVTGGLLGAAILAAGSAAEYVSEQKVVNRGGWLDRRLPGRKAKLEAARKDLGRNTKADLDLMETSAREALRERMAQHEKRLDNHIGKIRQEALNLTSQAGILTLLANGMKDSVETVDALTARTLLLTVGRRRAAMDVQRSWRIPGVGIGLAVPSRTRDELALFPAEDAAEPLLSFDDARVNALSRALDVVAAAAYPPYDVGPHGSGTLELRVGSQRQAISLQGTQAIAVWASGADVRLSRKGHME